MPANTDRKYNGERVSQRVERIAAGVLDIRARSPRLGYGEVKRRVMEKFGCGHRSAERAMKIAAAKTAATIPEKQAQLEEVLWAVIEDGRAKGDGVEVVRAAHELARINGLHAPKKVEHSGLVMRLDVSNMSDEELEEELAKTQSIEQRAKERAEKSGADADD